MQRYQQNGIEWLEFDLLADIPSLKHAVFLRHGGVSQKPYDTLNASYDMGDDPTCVKTNLERIQAILQKDCTLPISLKWAKQSHGKYIALINEQTPQETLNCDALITQSPGIALMIKHADCQAAVFYDAKHHAVANVHAGWRGIVQNIYADTVKAMQAQFGSNPADLLVGISPSLGPDDAEFIHYNQEFPEELWEFQTKPTYFNLWDISEHQLQSAGILPHHIEIMQISTLSNVHDFFSYRHQSVTGRNATCILLETS